MAYFNFEISPEFLKQIGRLADVDRIAPKMLEEAVPIVEEKLRNAIKTSHSRTGDLYKSIQSFKPRKTKSGAWIISAAPTGRANKLKRAGKVYKRSKSGRKTSGVALYNDDKLFYLEYGTSKQPATPVITKVVKDSEPAVLAKMQEVFNREVGIE